MSTSMVIRDGGMKSSLTRLFFNTQRMLSASIENRQESGGGTKIDRVPCSHADTELILKATSSMVAVLDKDARYTYVSPSHEPALGYAPGDLVGKTGFDLIHPEDRDRMSGLLAKALAGDIDSIKPLTYRLIHRDGQIRYVRGLFNTVRDRLGRLEKIICVSDDITEIIEMESALEISEQRLRSIVDTVPTPIAEIDRKGGFLFTNNAYSRVFEYSRDELKTMTIGDLAESPEDGQRLLALIEKLALEQPPPRQWEGRNLTKSGKKVDVVIDWDYKRDVPGEVTGFLTAISDVTERKKTSLALRQSQQRYQAMFNNISAAVAVYQPIADGQDFVLLDFNKTAEKIEKISKERILNRRVTEIFPGVKDFGLLEVFRRVNKTGLPEEHPVALYRDDRIAGWRKNYVYKLPGNEIVAVYIDETDRMKAEEAQSESEAKFRSLVEYSADHIFMLNRDGEYLFSNDRSGQDGFSQKNPLIGKTLESAYPPDVAARFRRLLAHVFRHGNATSFEHDAKDEEGWSTYLNTLYPVYKDGKPWAVGGISRDITTRKRYEQELQDKTIELEKTLHELRRTQRRIIDTERQRALSQMASGIAHDFNNSLTSIQGFSDLLLQTPQKMNDPKTVKDYVTLINTSARAAAEIVRRLRKFYRPSDNEIIEPVDINRLVDEAIALTEPVWKSNAQTRGAFITIEKQLEPDAAVSGNRTELHEVVTNLIFNAVDAMPDGGVIRFITRREQDRIVLEVSDTGFGMETDVLRQCLNPFYTTKGETGSGLGLATVQGIITRHQGRIDIHSRPGEGTVFILHLPAAVLSNAAPATDKPAKQEPGALRILIVDDEERQRFLLDEYLKKDNHLTETAVNGVDAMRKFNEGWFDLVITDNAMPELNGDALARTIKKAAPGKPVIMLTGFGDMLTSGADVPEAVDLLISKPVTLEQLREAIQQVLEGKNDKPIN